MASAISNMFRLARAGLVFAQHGVSFVPKGHKVPLLLHVVRALTWSADGSRVVTAGDDGVLRVYSDDLPVASPRALHTRIDAATSAVISAEGVAASP